MSNRSRVVLNDLRVQQVRRPGGEIEATIMKADGSVHETADRFLRGLSGGTDRTYAYLLVDHLRWIEAQGLRIETVRLSDLERYMGAVGAKYRGPLGEPWRRGSRPYGDSTLAAAASCLKGFYKCQGSLGVNRDLATEVDGRRLPSKADRSRSFLGHAMQSMQSNPLMPKQTSRSRSVKLPPVGAKAALTEVALSARNRMITIWLADSGMRVGELCGLHLVDLHLRASAACGEVREPHVHICHRENNPNGARVKTKQRWSQDRNGTIVGGKVRLASPAMLHAYFEYMTSEYPVDASHGMLIVSLAGPSRGEPLTTDGVRAMLRRNGARADIGHVIPHAFRHQFATDVMAISDGNTIITREAGGWASAATVEQVYTHSGPDDPAFRTALQKVWGEDR